MRYVDRILELGYVLWRCFNVSVFLNHQLNEFISSMEIFANVFESRRKKIVTIETCGIAGG